MAISDIRAEKEEMAQGEDIPPPKRGPGRPKGSGKKPAPAAPDIPPEVVAQMLDETLKELVQVPCHINEWPLLSDQERDTMVAATRPLINKYGGDILGEWAPEIVFIAMCLAMYGGRYRAANLEKQRKASFDRRGDRHRENASGERTGPELHTVDSGGPIM